MSSSKATVEGAQLNCTTQQKPVDAMGTEAEIRSISVAEPPRELGARALLGSSSWAELGRPAADGREKVSQSRG